MRAVTPVRYHDAGVRTLAFLPCGSARAAAGLFALALGACRGQASSVGSNARWDAAADGPQATQARLDDAVAATPVQQESQQGPLQEARIVEVQHIIGDGAQPGRLARFISECASEQACQVARRMALGALRTVTDRPARLSALIDAGHAPGVKPEDDPLWPDLVQSLSETWAATNTAGGRKRMLRETDARTRRLLVSSLAVYAASNRGLSDMAIPRRRALGSELMQLYPMVPPAVQHQIDAFLARIDVNARGTL